ncbi:MAG: class I SAM-dependent methyltransferase [archaeon]
MPIHQRPKRNLIIDVGAGRGEFTEELRRRNPSREVLALDRESQNPKVKKISFGFHFADMPAEEASRLHAVWLNHIDVITPEGHMELRALAKKLPIGVPAIFTIRKERLAQSIHSIEEAGLVVKGQRPYSPKMIGSDYTKKFYEESKGNSDKAPIRLVAMKPKPRN